MRSCAPSCQASWPGACAGASRGSNTAWAHPILFRRIEDAKRANPALKIIVVDPRRTDTCELADLHLAIQPGTDVMLFNGLLHIMLWSLVIFGMASALSGIMRASGSVLVPTLISIVCIVGVEVPVAWAVSHRIGLNGVWVAYPAAFVAMLILQTSYYRAVWRKKAIKRLV